MSSSRLKTTTSNFLLPHGRMYKGQFPFVANEMWMRWLFGKKLEKELEQQ